MKFFDVLLLVLLLSLLTVLGAINPPSIVSALLGMCAGMLMFKGYRQMSNAL